MSPVKLNTKMVIAQRQSMVSRLALRGLQQQEIVMALAKEGMVNPNSDLPYSGATISRDMKKVRLDWKKSATQDIDVWTAQILAELNELKRRAWAEGNLELVRRVIKDMRDLLGVDEPIRIESTSTSLSVEAVVSVTPEQAALAAQALHALLDAGAEPVIPAPFVIDMPDVFVGPGDNGSNGEPA